MSALSAHIGKLVEFSRYRECARSASYPSFVQSPAKRPLSPTPSGVIHSKSRPQSCPSGSSESPHRPAQPFAWRPRSRARYLAADRDTVRRHSPDQLAPAKSPGRITQAGDDTTTCASQVYERAPKSIPWEAVLRLPGPERLLRARHQPHDHDHVSRWPDIYRASTTKVLGQQNRFAPEQRGATTKRAIIKNPDTPFQTESLPLVFAETAPVCRQMNRVSTLPIRVGDGGRHPDPPRIYSSSPNRATVLTGANGTARCISRFTYGSASHSTPRAEETGASQPTPNPTVRMTPCRIQPLPKSPGRKEIPLEGSEAEVEARSLRSVAHSNPDCVAAADALVTANGDTDLPAPGSTRITGTNRNRPNGTGPVNCVLT